MKKVTRLFFLIIILALIIHGLILLFLFGNKFLATKQPALKQEVPHAPKPVTIEHVKPLDLPNMMPGQPTLTTPPTPVEPELDQPDTPELPNEANNLIPKADLDSPSAPQTKPAKPKKRTHPPKPTFNFDQLNHYAIAEGNSIFKNQGENRAPTKEDLAILMYQERARKHFTISMNRYADQANFYNIHRAAIDLIIVIGQDGRVLDIRTRNHSNNPAMPSLMEKIVKYAGLFPAIPAATKIPSFTLITTVTIAQGKLKSGYGWQ